MENPFDETYWTNRYNENHIGWDIGFISTPIKQYLDQISEKSKTILIPGAGNAYEAAYAFEKGFKNIHILDFSRIPIEKFLKENPEFPVSQAHVEDFFSHEGEYDLILEQTFFCALHPKLRQEYIQKADSLLKTGGKMVGVLFNHYFQFDGPPFGGDRASYLHYFEKTFEIITMQPCHNSIPDRAGMELFFIARKK
ncbi:class I SAM-dependent methyltransferase [Pleomorphovibrio marinus]|uniref:SAM-dependent methyltransferase n=1 Tax=Pleomorphovibrio marinus TaxID=2164132 RepID=UPI000E0CAA71|nr:SAM-dependent methyltransferase [Pleomorphovibrio marinus]